MSGVSILNERWWKFDTPISIYHVTLWWAIDNCFVRVHKLICPHSCFKPCIYVNRPFGIKLHLLNFSKPTLAGLLSKLFNCFNYVQNSGCLVNQSKIGCKDQESIQSSTTPDPGYQWESDKLTEDTTNESQEVSPFPEGDHEAHINRRAQNIANTRQNKNIKDPQKKYRLGTVSKTFYWRA